MRNNCITGYLPFLLALLAISMLVVIACGGGDEPTEAPATAPLPTATQVPTAMHPRSQRPLRTQPAAPTAAPTVASPTTVPAATEAPQPTSTPEPTATPVPYPAVPGIVDPSNLGWPRDVETLEGVVTLEAPPTRILTYSLGHDEMLIALVPPDRVAALGKFASNSAYSNVADIAPEYPVFEKGAENVLAAEPDLFIVSAFTKADIVDLVKDAGGPGRQARPGKFRRRKHTQYPAPGIYSRRGRPRPGTGIGKSRADCR